MDSGIKQERQRINELLLEMGELVESNLAAVIEHSGRRDWFALEEVIHSDADVDLLELRVDEACIDWIARYHPVAGDLRWAATALKIVKDIERIGDLAKDLARQGIAQIHGSHPAFPENLREMAGRACELLDLALNSFVTQDAGLARQVLDGDAEIDSLYRKNLGRFVQGMVEKPEEITLGINYISVNKYLERVGDHSRNIAAMVVYMVQGKDIRHFQKQGLKDEA